MTQEEKKLLIQDLSARLPYGVMVQVKCGKVRKNGKLWVVDTNLEEVAVCLEDEVCLTADNFDIENVKPYLRPMKSMSDKEYEEYEKRRHLDTLDSAESLKQKAVGKRHISSWYRGADWLLEHHFDFRGLIEKGLAIEY